MPFRLGGGRRALRVFEAIQNGRGSSYSTSQSSAVYAENVGIARTIDRDVYGANARLAAQFTPSGMTAAGLLPRWEKILGITPSGTATEASRRNVVAATWLRIGQGNWDQMIRDAILPILGPFFVGIQYDTGTNALEWWPNLTGNLKITATGVGTGGQTVAIAATTSGPQTHTAWYGQSVTISNASSAGNNGTFFIYLADNSGPTQIEWNNPNASAPDNGVGGSSGSPTIAWKVAPLVPWSSTVAHVRVQVQVPVGQTEAQFQAAVGGLFPVLDSIMPAWATWDWWRVDSVQGTMGFFLDSPHNLDNDAFDV